MSLFRAAPLLLAFALLLSGCGGGKLYKSLTPNNLQVNTNAKQTKVMLDIYTVEGECQLTYQGSVALKEKSTVLGLATGRPFYLRVAFSSSSFLGGSSSYTSYDTLLTPRPGYQYEMDVRYIDNIYNVELFETARSGGMRRELQQRQCD